MKPFFLHWRLPLRLALLLLLLSMQSISLAHELDRGSIHDGSVCVTCSIGSGHTGIPAAEQECLLANDASNPPSFSPVSPAAAQLRQIPEARAPPVTLQR